MKKEHPILFKTEMVKAILEGRKTMTRRVIKPQPEQKIMGGKPYEAMKNLGINDNPLGWTWKETRFMPWPAFLEKHFCTFGQVGDLLWVKETYQYTDSSINIQPGYVYKASDPDWDTMEGWKWKPSLFMPKAAARVWLEITNIKVERLQDISEEDAKAEGVNSTAILTNSGDDYTGLYASEHFQTLWQSINGEESWNANPWVWVIEFKKTSKPIADAKLKN